MYPEKIKTQSLLNGLRRHEKILPELLKTTHDYNQFIQELMKINEIFIDGNIVYVKKVSEQTQTSPAKIRRYLELIYDDIVEFLQDENKESIKFGAPTCSISIKDRWNKYFYLENIQLEVIPKVGEAVELHFLYPLFSWPYFEVCNVWHDFDYHSHRINISLKRKYNRYVEMMKDEKEYEKDKEYWNEEMDVFHLGKYLHFKRGEWK